MIFKLLRNTTAVVILLCSMASVTISATVWATVATYKAVSISSALAAQTITHRRALFRQATKARLRRIVVAVPAAGVAAGIYFENNDRKEWLSANPNKTNNDYACETALMTTEVADEVLADLPISVKLPNWAVPECTP